jgi:tetratricopeptide (TPR) repeat protein
MKPYTRYARFGLTAALLVSLSALVSVAGCAKKNVQASGQPKTDSPWVKNTPKGHQAKPQPRDDFERGKDEPISADTYFAAGQLSETQDAASRAEEYYGKALTSDPMHKGSLFRLGVMCAKQKRFGEAIDCWQKYVKATNGEATGYANLGFCLELAGRSDEAETAYRNGIKANPLNAPCRINFGLMLARHERINEAMLEMQTVLPESQVHYNIASVLEAHGKKDEARVEYRRALQSDPKMTDAQVRLDAMN